MLRVFLLEVWALSWRTTRCQLSRSPSSSASTGVEDIITSPPHSVPLMFPHPPHSHPSTLKHTASVRNSRLIVPWPVPWAMTLSTPYDLRIQGMQPRLHSLLRPWGPWHPLQSTSFHELLVSLFLHLVLSNTVTVGCTIVGVPDCYLSHPYTMKALKPAHTRTKRSSLVCHEHSSPIEHLSERLSLQAQGSHWKDQYQLIQDLLKS